jgi:hypothetical protein
MRMFAVLAAALLGGRRHHRHVPAEQLSIGAWYAGTVLLIFAAVGWSLARQERVKNSSKT